MLYYYETEDGKTAFTFEFINKSKYTYYFTITKNDCWFGKGKDISKCKPIHNYKFFAKEYHRESFAVQEAKFRYGLNNGFFFLYGGQCYIALMRCVTDGDYYICYNMSRNLYEYIEAKDVEKHCRLLKDVKFDLEVDFDV